MKPNNEPKNTLKDSNSESFVFVSDYKPPTSPPPQPSGQNSQQLLPPPQSSGLNGQILQPSRNVHLGHLDQEKRSEFVQQINNSANISRLTTAPNNPDLYDSSNMLSTSAKMELVLDDVPPQFVNDVSQVDESFREFSKDLLLSLEPTQQNVQHPNPSHPVTGESQNSFYQSRPQQSQSSLLAKKAAPEEGLAQQNFPDNLSNDQVQPLPPHLPGSFTSPAFPPVMQLSTPSHNNSFNMRDNGARTDQPTLPDYQSLQSNKSIHQPGLPSFQQQVQSPLPFEGSQNSILPPPQMPNDKGHFPNNPYSQGNLQQVPLAYPLNLTPGQPVQDQPLICGPNHQSFHQAPSTPNTNQYNPQPMINNLNQFANQFNPPRTHNPSQGSQAQNNHPANFYPPHQGHQNQQPPYYNRYSPAYPSMGDPNYQPQYPNWPPQAPTHIPGPHVGNLPFNPYGHYPQQTINNHQAYNYANPPTSFNNNFQTNNFPNSPYQPLLNYPTQPPSDIKPSSHTNLDNQTSIQVNDSVDASFSRPRNDQAQLPHKQYGQYAPVQQQQLRPENPAQNVSYDHSFTQQPSNNESVHPRPQNLNNKSINQPRSPLLDNSLFKQKAKEVQPPLAPPSQNQSFRGDPNTSVHSSNQLKNDGMPNKNADFKVQPTNNQTNEIAKPLFSKFHFDPEKIIHFIQYSEASENGVIVEKYLLSDAELIRFGGLISEKDRQPLIRSDEVDGIVVEFKKLASMRAKFIGAFGRPKVMFQALADNSFIAHKEISLFQKHFKESGSGLYLLPISHEKEALQILLILYSNDERDFDNVDEKRSYVRLLRYLTQLCSFNIVAINQEDVALVSFEEGKRPKDFYIFKPEVDRLTEDECQITEGKIIDNMSDSKKLVASSSFSGFYTKALFPSKTDMMQNVHQWKSKTTYDKLFTDCMVNVDKLENIPVETMHTFLQDHFYDKFQTAKNNLPREVKRLEELIKDVIDREAMQKIKSRKTLYAVKCMKVRHLPEYNWLEQAAKQKKIANAEELADISAAYNQKVKLTVKDKQLFQLIEQEISNCNLFETEVLGIRRILEEHEIFDLDNVYSAFKDCQAQSTSPQASQQLKSNLYNDVVAKVNSARSFPLNLLPDWDVDKLTQRIKDERLKGDFLNKNSKACTNDALRLFKLYYDKVGRHFSFAAIEEETRKEHRLQLEPAAKKNLLFQAIKDCLERKEGKGVVSITDLKKRSSVSYELKYQMQVVTEAYNEYSVSQYELRKSELDDSRMNPGLVLCPVSRPVTTFQLPESFQLINLIFMKGKKLAAVVNSKGRSQIRFYSTARPNEVLFSRPFGQTINKMDYNEGKKKIAFYTQKDSEASLYVYGISDDFHVNNEASIDLTARFGIQDVHLLCLGNSNEVFIVDGQGDLRSVDYRNQTARKINIFIEGLKSMVLVPRANCLLLISSTSVTPYVIETGKALPEIPLSSAINLDNLVITKFDSQSQLLFEYKGKICNKLLTCILSTESYRLVESTIDGQREDFGNSNRRSIFDYFGSIYAKFSVFGPMEALSKQSLEQKLVIYCSHARVHNQPEEEKIKSKLKEIQDNIQKPHSEKLGLSDNAVFILPGENHSQLLHSQSSIQSLDRWVQELISLVPVQIGRTENNQYIILKEGQPLQLANAQNVYEVKEKISYGLIETILNNWHKPVKVISSMGKQSTGKSYTLNHLSGATFAIAGGRCTDGCWLALKITDECLYVLMDFEGLGSFERSEQEDMLLSIKNAALSNITLYKTAFSLDKETDKMFNRFNQGANLLKGDDKIFKGLFCLLIKDVDDKDVREIVNEFSSKVTKIIEKGDKKDFITTMYGSGFAINTFDFFKNLKYYDQINKLAQYIRNHIQSSFANGRDFLSLLKTIQAKLAIQDFTSLSRQDIDTRIYILSEHYPSAFRFGNLADQRDNRKMYILKNYDDAENIVEEEIEVEINEPNSKALKLVYSDPDIDLTSESCDFINVFSNSFAKTEKNHAEWSSLFRHFVKLAVKKRTARVLQWVDLNLQKWAQAEEFQELVANFKQLISHKAKENEMRYQICLSNCSSCFAACTLLNSHVGDHSCGLADHKCKSMCAYCNENNQNEPCSLDFGHNEHHTCSSYSHTCGSQCEYPKCKGNCIQGINHAGPHKCRLLQHICPEQCSLSTCSNRCQIPLDKQHTVHKCVNDQCSKSCEVQGCRNRCECRDHFHDHGDLSRQFKMENGADLTKPRFVTAEGKEIDIDFHCCGIAHPCAEDCAQPGFCKVVVERKIVQEEFKGKKGQFKYQKQFENVGSKLKCCKPIPEYQKAHEGHHLHSIDPATVHTCETRCPTCNNICEKETNHPGKHNTAHGNMEKCYFIANQDDIDVGDHKYVVGESAVAEMCHMFCKSLGRGHVHLVECGHAREACPNRDEGRRRHETCQYGPDINVSKDEMLHEVYWDLINFEDPCQKMDVEEYSKCPFYCGSKDHEEDKEQRYCQQKLWHKAISNISETGKAQGYVSKDGHYYECTHKQNTKGHHFVFCLDKSGSMKNKPWEDLKAAVNAFCIARSASTADRLSIVTFDDTQLVACENILFNQFNANNHLVYRGGGTRFAPAIAACHQLFRRTLSTDMIPIFVFMSDGGDKTGDAEITNLNAEFGPSGLQVFAIAFGSIQPKLKQLADLVSGAYSTTIDGIALKNEFIQISSRFATIISVARSKK